MEPDFDRLTLCIARCKSTRDILLRRYRQNDKDRHLLRTYIRRSIFPASRHSGCLPGELGVGAAGELRNRTACWSSAPFILERRSIRQTGTDGEAPCFGVLLPE